MVRTAKSGVPSSCPARWCTPAGVQSFCIRVTVLFHQIDSAMPRDQHALVTVVHCSDMHTAPTMYWWPPGVARPAVHKGSKGRPLGVCPRPCASTHTQGTSDGAAAGWAPAQLWRMTTRVGCEHAWLTMVAAGAGSAQRQLCTREIKASHVETHASMDDDVEGERCIPATAHISQR